MSVLQTFTIHKGLLYQQPLNIKDGGIKDSGLTVEFAPNMVNYCTVFLLWAKHYNVSIFFRPNAVSWRPVEEVSSSRRFFAAICIQGGDRSIYYISPMWTLATILLKTMQQSSDISSGTKREVFSSHLSVSGYFTKINLLSGSCTRHIDSNRYIFFCYAHNATLQFMGLHCHGLPLRLICF
jgi:hypothetical protein